MPFRHFHENNKGTELTRIRTIANKSKHFVSVVSHNRSGCCEQTGLNEMIAYINMRLSLFLLFLLLKLAF